MKSSWSTSSARASQYLHCARAQLYHSTSSCWQTRNIDSWKQVEATRATATEAGMEQAPNYKEWSHDDLIQRVNDLELALEQKSSSFTPVKAKKLEKPRAKREFNPSNHSSRLIALKFAYFGQRYNGFEYHSKNITPRTTIEEELWKALNKARLIFPKEANPREPGEVNWEGCEYSKCGRTDKGVSAFGQVIGIRVRSNRPLKSKVNHHLDRSTAVHEYGDSAPEKKGCDPAIPALSNSIKLERAKKKLLTEAEISENDSSFDPIADEISYPTLLNRLLPPDIRILAWCPEPPPDFSARFSCRERQYKYFFTQPAFPPMPNHFELKREMGKEKGMKDSWLDIEAMREAAKKFVGVQDFRNFCKVDPSKQIVNFERHIFYADIVEEDSTHTLGFVNSDSFLPTSSQSMNGLVTSYPKIYSFTLHGSAFLWHQVRHMVAILFLIGQGFETPSIISELLDVEKNPRRPIYEMASDKPLVLWNCVFPREGDPERKDGLDWVYVGDGVGNGTAKYGSSGLLVDVWKLWRERKINETLAAKLIDVVTAQGADVASLTTSPRRGAKSQKVFDGGDAPRPQGTYIPVMKKPMMDTTETINERFALRKGFQSSEDMKPQGSRRRRQSVDIFESVDD